MSHLTANELKTRGISAIEAALTEDKEAILSVRGQDRYVVVSIDHYHYLRECELEAALAQSREDIASGRYTKSSAAEHLERITQSNR